MDTTGGSDVLRGGGEAASTIATAKEEGAYVRKASGLVRAWSPFDAWVFNMFAINVVIQVALVYVLVPVTYPGASTWVSVLIAGAFCTAEAVVYAYLVTAMPRSGGDYVFQGRILGGGWATIFAFNIIAPTAAIFTGLAGYLGATLILAPFLTLLGNAYDLNWMVSVGAWFNKPIGIFVTGLACIAWGTIVTMVGMRFYALIQRWMFVIGAVTMGILMVAVLFSGDHAFQTHLNSLMSSQYGVDNAYEKVLSQGNAPALTFSLWACVLGAVPAAFSLIYPGWSAQTGGEIKRASSVRSNAYAIVGAAVAATLVMVVTAALLQAKVGNEFLYSAGALFYGGNSPLPVAPFFGFLFALIPGSTFFVWVAFVMFNAWFWMWFPNIPLAGSRAIVAASFDKVLPEWLGRVNAKTHTPVNAIAVYGLLTIPLVALYAFDTGFVTLTLGLALIGMSAIGVTMVAAMLFPYRRRELFHATSIAKYKLFGLPAIVPAAATFLVFIIFNLYKYFTDDSLGINGTSGLIFVGATYVFTCAIYVSARIYRKKKENLDLGMVYRELPIE